MNVKMWRIGLAVAVAFLMMFSLVGLAGADKAPPGTIPTRHIVVFQDWVVNEAAQQTIIERTGGRWVKSLPLINAAVVLAYPANERALETHPGVLRVDKDTVVYALPGPVTVTAKPPKPTPTPQPAEVLPWGVDRIDADLAWATSRGAGVKVAVLDTGIDLDHPDLQANIKGGINTINSLKSANDDNGHGTHIAGIIAAVDNDIGVIGVAPEAHLYAVKVLNRQGSGFVSDVIEGLQWSIDNGMQVVNMSFGSSADNQSLHDAVIKAYNAGIVLVAAAGNSGPADNTVNYPAKYAEVIAVSATDKTDALANFSSRGPEVELAAPGVDVYSTWKGDGYNTLSGTSMATPHVSGTAALSIASHPGYTNLQIRTLLQNTADDLGAVGRDNLYGYGLVDAEEATTGVQTHP
ncbi:MAG: S8 family peptidase [Chloroflexi bacterium]|nr:S8 family peptidase [Chloroflexota bacterium]MCL5076010.1 S8 family peptidase [Chloroflexota bacterium]